MARQTRRQDAKLPLGFENWKSEATEGHHVARKKYGDQPIDVPISMHRELTRRQMEEHPPDGPDLENPLEPAGAAGLGRRRHLRVHRRPASVAWRNIDSGGQRWSVRIKGLRRCRSRGSLAMNHLNPSTGSSSPFEHMSERRQRSRRKARSLQEPHCQAPSIGATCAQDDAQRLGLGVRLRNPHHTRPAFAVRWQPAALQRGDLGTRHFL
jgi:hypothetical protein